MAFLRRSSSTACSSATIQELASFDASSTLPICRDKLLSVFTDTNHWAQVQAIEKTSARLAQCRLRSD
jgi:hypothetical protein